MFLYRAIKTFDDLYTLKKSRLFTRYKASSVVPCVPLTQSSTIIPACE